MRLLAPGVDHFLEVRPGPELRRPALRHLDLGAGRGVPRRTRRLVHHLERAEARDRDLVTGRDRFLDRIDYRVNGLGGRLLLAHPVGDGVNEFPLVHLAPPVLARGPSSRLHPEKPLTRPKLSRIAFSIKHRGCFSGGAACRNRRPTRPETPPAGPPRAPNRAWRDRRSPGIYGPAAPSRRPPGA